MELKLFHNNIIRKSLGSWDIIWNDDNQYRHWCIQCHKSNSGDIYIAIVLFNPGSLSGDGINLNKDLTLRILRNAFAGSCYKMLILNLYSFSAPKSLVFFNNWGVRDDLNKPLVFGSIPLDKIKYVIYAYGDYENTEQEVFAKDIIARINYIKSIFKDIKEIKTPLNYANTPQHPYRWQLLKEVKAINKKIIALN